MTTIINGMLTEADHKGHIPVVFDVPPRTTRLSVTFAASPARAKDAFFDNLISLSLFGPAGPRGARHNNDDMNIVIDAAHATPGYVRGLPEPGRWTLWLDTFRILGPDPVSWEVRVMIDTAPILSAAAMAEHRPAPRGQGWYRGDLHAHSWHSDAVWDIPDLVAWARTRQLDFVTLTDHNTVSGHEEMRARGGPDLLTMGGVELTTHRGHALSLGHSGWQEWRTGSVSGKTMPGIATEVMARGAAFVIAHPRSPGDPACTGCRWEFDDLMPGPARLVEIWNGGPWADYNEEGLALYRAWLAEGHRLMATAGSDHHGQDDAGEACGFNNVHAADLTETAVLDAVRAGRNFLSSGPRLVLWAQAPGAKPVEMGGATSRVASLAVEWATTDADLRLNIVGPEGRIGEVEVKAGTSGRMAVDEVPDIFVMAELRASDGTLHAVTNPIFIE
ncbi:MAG: CehA/McbA family metallohydrolase [Tabrizicola sp.]|nr:CehA/McbA family metallohydrolase [Tabrizicola sp.]